MTHSDVTNMRSGAGTDTMSLDALSLLSPHQCGDGIFLGQYLETMCHCVDLQAFTPKPLPSSHENRMLEWFLDSIKINLNFIYRGFEVYLK
jgi:hypothetical protein